MGLINSITHIIQKYRFDQLRKDLSHVEETQSRIFSRIIFRGKNTEYGVRYNFSAVKDPGDLKEKLPVTTYKDLYPYISKMIEGEEDQLWPGRIKRFAKSSGTTTGKSKYIPLPEYNLRHCHLRGSRITSAILYHNFPEANLTKYSSVIIAGNLNEESNSVTGDISAHMLSRVPLVARRNIFPSLDIALHPEWEYKLDEMVKHARKYNVQMLSGVPTWLIVLLKKMSEFYQTNNLHEIWPEMQIVMHGGVKAEPYKEIFKNYFPQKDLYFQEVYNATEGFFGTTLYPDQPGMLLLTNNDIFYEFIPLSDYHQNKKDTLQATEVAPGIDYVPVITTTAGLYRYIPGDTVRFFSTDPLLFTISGRTTQYLNAFGEEVMLHNIEKALDETSKKFNTQVQEYTVSVKYLDEKNKGAHEWAIEFKGEPPPLKEFEKELDKTLQSLNSDYEAKRSSDLALSNLSITPVPEGTFWNYMKKENKSGGQNKIPRLSHDRTFLEEIFSESS